MAEKPDILLLGPTKPLIVDGLSAAFSVHKMATPKDDGGLAAVAPRVRAIAVSGPPGGATAALMAQLPRLEIVSSFGVGYDNIDAEWAGQHGVTVTNTPDVLTEEVADTTIGLLLNTVREFPQAERYLRAWWVSAASARPSRGGWTPCRSRSSITAGGRSRT
jgi:lactate dehydrogenase-like 2-hydroxyacid dehydrogenase